MIYFAPEADEEFTAVGLRPGRMGYFASRSAPMGPVPAGVTAATFYNFNPALVARHIPRAWGAGRVERHPRRAVRAADRALRRLLGDEVVAGARVAEAAELARAATVACARTAGRCSPPTPSLDWPAEPHLVLWHAITLLREYRGDGHVAALLAAGLSGLDALITHTATGRGFTDGGGEGHPRLVRRRVGGAAWPTCAARGLLDDDGLTAAGQATRDSVEVRHRPARGRAVARARRGRTRPADRARAQPVAAGGRGRRVPGGVFAGGP